VDEVEAMPQAILDNAQGGDVVMCMGAGSIGLVPGKIVDMLETTEPNAPAGH
jgi:UDP-N-acetylmuramate--alanine ligase